MGTNTPLTEKLDPPFQLSLHTKGSKGESNVYRKPGSFNLNSRTTAISFSRLRDVPWAATIPQDETNGWVRLSELLAQRITRVSNARPLSPNSSPPACIDRRATQGPSTHRHAESTFLSVRSSKMKKVLFISMCVCVGLVSMASGDMLITNGDFESGLIPGTGDFADVPDWVDSNADNFWSKPWIKDGNQPAAGGSAAHNGTAVVLMSALSAGPAIDGAGLLGYVYQNIGTADGALEVKIGFETGIPLDGPGELPGRDYGVTWTILQTDGSFVPGDELDILGAAGVTVIDQQTLLYTGKIVGDVETEEWTFDLSSADTSDLYLRFNTYSGVNNDPWIGLDNVAIVPVPEPATMSLLAIGGLGVLLMRRRRRA